MDNTDIRKALKLPHRQYLRSDAMVYLTGTTAETVVYKHKSLAQRQLTQLNSNDKRSQKRCRRIIQTNAWGWTDVLNRIHIPFFHTLTFKNRDTSISQAKKEFNLYTKRLNWNIYGSRSGVLKYTQVIEPQQDGTPHFHIMVYNLPYIKDVHLRIKEWWKNGRCDIHKIENVRDVGRYVTKYMTKGSRSWFRRKHVKMHSSSKGVIKPEVLRGDEARTYMRRLFPYKPVFQYHGSEVFYRVYRRLDGQPTRSSKTKAIVPQYGEQ